MGLATTFRFDSGWRGERTTSRVEFAAALTIVVALHAALALWVLRSHEPPVRAPQPPRTIVARLLSTAPDMPLGPAAKPAPAPPAPPAEPPRAAPPRAVVPPRAALPARARPPAAPRPAHRETPAPVARATPTPAPSPQEPAAPAAAPTPPAAATTIAPSAPAADTTQHATAAQPAAAANAPPKEVSHVDCNIAQPDYPEISRRRNETGTAVVRFVVGVDGRVESATLQQSSGYARLDGAALDAVRGGTCRPWKEAGAAVRVAYAQPFVFGLGN